MNSLELADAVRDLLAEELVGGDLQVPAHYSMTNESGLWLLYEAWSVVARERDRNAALAALVRAVDNLQLGERQEGVLLNAAVLRREGSLEIYPRRLWSPAVVHSRELLRAGLTPYGRALLVDLEAGTGQLPTLSGRMAERVPAGFRGGAAPLPIAAWHVIEPGAAAATEGLSRWLAALLPLVANGSTRRDGAALARLADLARPLQTAPGQWRELLGPDAGRRTPSGLSGCQND